MDNKRGKISHTPILLTLAANMRYYRRQLGMSQEKLAELADLHPTYISNVEQAKRNISIENVYRIASAFGISVSQLLLEMDLNSETRDVKRN